MMVVRKYAGDNPVEKTQGSAMIFLSEPNTRYRESFIEGLREFQREGRMLQYDLESVCADFPSFVRRLQAQARQNGAGLPPNYIADTDFWLIDGEEFIGRLSLRPKLNEILLKLGGHIGYQVRPSKRCMGYGKAQLGLGLQKAREIGLKRVLVTCDENNIASQKVIEYHGGQLENAILIEGSPVRKLRYWIDLN
jgi:predicted acetyltransferase